MKQDLLNILINPEKFEIRMDGQAVELFNTFLEGRYKWAVSGVDWRDTNYIYRVNCEFGYSKVFSDIRNKWPSYFSDSVNLYFNDGTYDVVLSSCFQNIIENMDVIENWDDYFILEFWLFDFGTGSIMEAYHEGYVTFASTM